MQQYEKYQRMLRRRRIAKAAAAWVALVLAGFFMVVGIWAFLVIVIGALG